MSGSWELLELELLWRWKVCQPAVQLCILPVFMSVCVCVSGRMGKQKRRRKQKKRSSRETIANTLMLNLCKIKEIHTFVSRIWTRNAVFSWPDPGPGPGMLISPPISFHFAHLISDSHLKSHRPVSFRPISRETECEWAAKSEGNVKPLCTLGGRGSDSDRRPKQKQQYSPAVDSSTQPPLAITPLSYLPSLVQNRSVACLCFGYGSLFCFCPLEVATTQWNPQRIGQKAWVKLWAQTKNQSQLHNLTLRFAAFPLWWQASRQRCFENQLKDKDTNVSSQWINQLEDTFLRVEFVDTFLF